MQVEVLSDPIGLGFLNGQVEDSRATGLGFGDKQTSVVELQQVLHRLIEAEMKEIILARINEDFAFRVIDPAVGISCQTCRQPARH